MQHASSGLAHVLPTGSTGILTVDWSTFSIYGNILHWLRAQLLTVGVANTMHVIINYHRTVYYVIVKFCPPTAQEQKYLNRNHKSCTQDQNKKHTSLQQYHLWMQNV